MIFNFQIHFPSVLLRSSSYRDIESAYFLYRRFLSFREDIQDTGGYTLHFESISTTFVFAFVYEYVCLNKHQPAQEENGNFHFFFLDLKSFLKDFKIELPLQDLLNIRFNYSQITCTCQRVSKRLAPSASSRWK